jgi:hypothetical protein
MFEEWELTLEQRPWTTNSERAGNRWQRAENVKTWRTAFCLLAKSKKIPTLENCEVTVYVYQKGGRLQDVAACNPAVKAAIDGLVDAKVMIDDSPKYLHSITFVAPQRGRNALTLILKGDVACITPVEKIG